MGAEEEQLGAQLKRYRQQVTVSCSRCGTRMSGRVAVDAEEAERFLAVAEAAGPVGGKKAVLERYCAICDEETGFEIPVEQLEPGDEADLLRLDSEVSKGVPARADPAFVWLDSKPEPAGEPGPDAGEVVALPVGPDILTPDPGPEQQNRLRAEAGGLHRKGQIKLNRSQPAEALAAFDAAIELYDQAGLAWQAALVRLDAAGALAETDPARALSLAEAALQSMKDDPRLHERAAALVERLSNRAKHEPT